jgi:hypothetical protein
VHMVVGEWNIQVDCSPLTLSESRATGVSY